jgi:hypothetical protein
VSTIEDRRVVITGLGIVSSVGTGLDKFWNALLSGKSGISKIKQFEADDMRCQIAGEIRDFDISDFIPPKEARRLDTFCHYAIGAAPKHPTPPVSAYSSAVESAASQPFRIRPSCSKNAARQNPPLSWSR